LLTRKLKSRRGARPARRVCGAIRSACLFLPSHYKYEYHPRHITFQKSLSPFPEIPAAIPRDFLYY
jgi:hypothetical protein